MKQLSPFSFELTNLEESQTYKAIWTPPITPNKLYKGKVLLSWLDFYITIYKAHPNDLLLDEHLIFIHNLPIRSKSDKLGNWFKGYCYLLPDNTIQYKEYS